jgi:hypothetical protein
MSKAIVLINTDVGAEEEVYGSVGCGRSAWLKQSAELLK